MVCIHQIGILFREMPHHAELAHVLQAAGADVLPQLQREIAGGVLSLLERLQRTPRGVSISLNPMSAMRRPWMHRHVQQICQ